MDDPVDQLASHTLAQYAAMAQALIDAAVSADLPEPRLGTNPGWPDLQLTGSDRQMFFLDLKRRGGRLSEPQGDARPSCWLRLCLSVYQQRRPGVVEV
jgi:hypothetical protein